MSDTVDLFRQIAEALDLTPGELLAFSQVVHAYRARIHELLEPTSSDGDEADGPQA